jgi:hypothetical protein
MISLMAVMQSGASVETATIGQAGVIWRERRIKSRVSNGV